MLTHEFGRAIAAQFFLPPLKVGVSKIEVLL
jgi:hypothetical protein